MTTSGASKLLQTGGRLVRVPKTMPTDWVLKHIAFPPPKAHFLPSVLPSGRTMPPRISLADQERIRLACKLAGIDAERVVGLPAEQPVDVSAKSLYPKRSSELEKFIREKKIAENMAKMPERIAAWKEERRKAKESAKPDMPF
ncbi:hypothetical protein HK105_202230 [Polyrhizophydium stewartii]|uniref:MRPL25 domain-containing protein n=1 Tax=Polyrhizophydium stewartii TaxID=2732419 RepID=A0ABR4NFJ0_9FUNG|nr:hypothetical protein HK105_007133 [Polyrhizophydium stewartii]